MQHTLGETPDWLKNEWFGDFRRSSGIQCLYLHQVEAIQSIESGFHTVIATSTAR
jgi:ATP-dependent helicase YprA (DUF1998 family)